MPRIGPSKMSRARSLLAALQELVRTLPTEAEKQDMHSAMAALESYLQHVMRELSSVSTQEGASNVLEALERLEALLARAEANPMVARAIGLERTPPRKRPMRVAPHDGPQVDAALHNLASMTIDQVRDSLGDPSQHSLADLRSIASAIGLKVQSRSTRENMVNHITTALANSRGYQRLSEPLEDETPS
jgi:hypothetical protein